ncbi:MAG: ABC transporter permease [Chloroflexi bacterium]|nr:ABC transporter permease [Chloroflexota bacterium]
MQHYILRRLLLSIPTLLITTLVIFILLHVVPGDPAVAILSGFGGEGSFTQEDVAVLRERLGLNRPLHIQYLDWLWRALHLDFGVSLRTEVAVLDEVKTRFAITFELALLTFAISLSLGISVGVISALRQDTWLDYLVRAISIAGLAIPGFFLATLVIIVLVRWFNWFPPIGVRPIWVAPVQNLQQLILPAVVLGVLLSAIVARMTRSQMLEVLRQDYVRTAWAKGLPERRVVLRHALKNALLPVLTIAGSQFGHLLGGTAIIEIIFNIPGLGQAMVTSVFNRDYPMVQALTAMIAFTFLGINLIVDIFYGVLDPRIRFH